jgi:hypothetical protein
LRGEITAIAANDAQVHKRVRRRRQWRTLNEALARWSRGAFTQDRSASPAAFAAGVIFSAVPMRIRRRSPFDAALFVRYRCHDDADDAVCEFRRGE